MLAKLGEAASVFDNSLTVKRGSAIALAPKFQREVLATDSASDLVLQGLIYELAGELSRRTSPKLSPDAPSWLRRAREMLHDMWNQSVSIEEIAGSVGVHPSHLNRVFRAHMNQTPGEYLRAIRMERATREVLATELPLKAIAAHAGFSDQAHFTREFRRHHGQSPLEMRRSARDQ
jgi:AraC family transcriptional regulator